MGINQNENDLHLYPINENEYIGAINMNVENTVNVSRVVVLLDSSGSMGAATSRFVKGILPSVMSKLNYAKDYEIHLITFSSKTDLHCLGDTSLKSSSIKSGGGTYIAPAIEMLRSTLESLQRDYPGYPIRVLTISDGAISDAQNAEKEMKKLIDFLATSDLTINSQAVRLFTSDAQPDTKALSYLLQINNCTATNLCDIKDTASNQAISDEIVALFQFDPFVKYQTLQFEKSIVLKFPWNSYQSMRIIVVPGWNIFWVKLGTGWSIFRSTIESAGTVKLGSDTIKVITEAKLTLDMFHQLMETKLAYVADHMTILKVVGTTEANRTVDQIFSYFKTKEDAIARKCSTTNNEIITNLLDGIVKNKTNFRDSAEMAEFLRQTNREMERQRRQREEEARRKREEEERIKQEEERIKQEEERIKQEEERIKQEEVERIKREAEELVKREEVERIQQEEEDRIKRESEELVRREEEERIKLDAEELVKREEIERIKREEDDRIKREEEELLKRKEEERIKREEMERVKREEERIKHDQEEHIKVKNEINQNENELHLYPINENEYIGAINMNVENTVNVSRVVVVLDSSGSMGAATPRFVREILPLVMSKLNYVEGYEMHLITFASKTYLHCLGDTSLKSSSIKSGGATYIAPAIEMLRSTLESLQQDYPGYPVRVLTISDGTIRDAQNAEKETKKLIDFLATSDLTINSQAVRLFTSNAQPDTKALSYLLQINNCTVTNICDIKNTASNQAISDAIVALFQFDPFVKYQTLQFEKSIILKFPWNTYQSMRIIVVPGWNIFWVKLGTGGSIFRSTIESAGTVKLGSDTIKVITEAKLTLDMFHQLLETKLAYVADHMTILKVVGTTEANRTVDQIFSYFKTKEDAIARKCSTTNNEIITNLLDGIVKNKTNFRDSAEMAEFLRKNSSKIEIQRRGLEEASKNTEEEELNKKEEEKRIKREVEERERVKRKEEERIKLEQEKNRIKQEEMRLNQLKVDNERKKEEERVEREKQVRYKRELEAERFKREKEEQERIKREKDQEHIKLEKEEERVKRELYEGRLKRVEELQTAKFERSLAQKTTISLVTTGTDEMDNDRNSVQTVFIVDEDVSVAENRFKIIPKILSKVFCENSQLIRLVTFVRYKKTTEHMLQSLLQTLDARKQIQILLLTNGDIQKRKEIENLAKVLNVCLNEYKYSFELQVVKFTSTETPTQRYTLDDIDADESNEFHAKQSAGHAYSKRSNDSHIQNYAERSSIQDFYCWFYLMIFGIIFALLYLRYIFLFSKITNSCPNN